MRRRWQALWFAEMVLDSAGERSKKPPAGELAREKQFYLHIPHTYAIVTHLLRTFPVRADDAVTRAIHEAAPQEFTLD